jgi:hypothetical protein
MLPIILFPTIYNLAVCSLGTLNPSEQFSICSTITRWNELATHINLLDIKRPLHMTVEIQILA